MTFYWRAGNIFHIYCFAIILKFNNLQELFPMASNTFLVSARAIASKNANSFPIIC